MLNVFCPNGAGFHGPCHPLLRACSPHFITSSQRFSHSATRLLLQSFLSVAQPARTPNTSLTVTLAIRVVSRAISTQAQYKPRCHLCNQGYRSRKRCCQSNNQHGQSRNHHSHPLQASLSPSQSLLSASQTLLSVKQSLLSLPQQPHTRHHHPLFFFQPSYNTLQPLPFSFLR